MEIEEVAAHNADVYNPGRPSAQKRKREKAQDQLRNRMRRRNNGTSSSMVSTRLRSNQRDRGDSTLLPGVQSISHNPKRNSSEEWRGQEARYGTLTHPDRVTGEKRHRPGEVPLTELVDRVIQRRSHATSNSSPMTIRAIKPPAPPFAIQHPGLIRKIQPNNKRKPRSGGPYVVVLNRSSSTKLPDSIGSTQESRDLPPLKQQSNPADAEIATWRPELTTTHEPYVHPNAEDRSVTNYRLQMQQAIKIAELRGDFSASVKPMHKHAPLPAIQVAYEVADKPQVNTVNDMVPADTKAETSEKLEVEDKEPDTEGIKNAPSESRAKTNRYTSSQEVLKLMQARKHAKKRKSKGNEFNTPLRTRNRFTYKMKVFKEDIQKARELSMIQEDQSSISDRLSRLSAGRTSVASFRSVGSLKRIEESEVPGCEKSIRRRQPLGVPEAKAPEGPEPSLPAASEESRIDSVEKTDSGITNANDTVPDPQEMTPSPPEDPILSDSNTMDDFPLNSADEKLQGQIEQHAQAPDPGNDHLESTPGLPGESADSGQIDRHTGDSHEEASSPRESRANESLETGAADAAPAPFDDPQVVVETRLAINQKSYEKTDSDGSIAADTFDMKDIILPAETVQ